MFIHKIDKTAILLSGIVLKFLIAVGLFMLVLTWVHVFFRYVLNNSLSWTEEALKMLLVWFCLVSASVLASDREHVKIVIFKEKLAKSIEKKVDLLTQTMTLLVSVLVTVVGVIMVINSANNISPALGIPMPYAYAAVPVAFALMSVYELRNLLHDLEEYRKNKPQGSKYRPTPEEIKSSLHE